MEKKAKYPIGDQDFISLRDRDCIYVDKTIFIDKLIDSGSKYYFLARPRRFGKSLFLSTLRYFFEGKRELFKGLYIDSTDWDWAEYPVLRLDLNTGGYYEPGLLDGVLNRLFREWEEKFAVRIVDENLTDRFANIVKAAHEKTGRQVVILVDEYDKPLVTNLNKNENFEHYRSKLASLYSNFKSSADHIRLVFLTGVSRFSRLSVFSDLNNIKDITFDGGFADICGITERELLDNFQSGISRLAKKSGITDDEARQRLKDKYDGYKFAADGSDIYNPWSVLNALDSMNIDDYWTATGYPRIIAEGLKRINADLEKIFDTTCSKEDLQGLDLLDINPIALMYQTGYITIKSYDPDMGEYQLGIPNAEVRRGLFRDLLPYYVKVMTLSPNQTISGIVRGFRQGDPDRAMKELQIYFAGIDYKMRIENENNFYNAFFLLINLIGLHAKTEVHTSDGSIDMVITTDKYVYIIELKYDHTAEEALRQIEEKRYSRPYTNYGRRIIEIGVSFSSKTRCIEDWKINPVE